MNAPKTTFTIRFATQADADEIRNAAYRSRVSVNRYCQTVLLAHALQTKPENANHQNRPGSG